MEFWRREVHQPADAAFWIKLDVMSSAFSTPRSRHRASQRCNGKLRYVAGRHAREDGSRYPARSTLRKKERLTIARPF